MNHLKIFCFSLVGALVLSLPTILNGLPFLFHDSTYYATLGIFTYSPDTYFWRPLTYSFFLRGCFFFYQSFVFPIFVQNFILIVSVSYFSLNVLKKWSWVFAIGLIVTLLTSPYLNLSNFLLADVFSGLLPLTLGLLWVERHKISWGALVGLVLVMALHYINLVIGLFGFVLLFWRRSRSTKKIILLMATLPFVVLTTLNWLQSEKIFLTNTIDIFLYSRLTAMGLTQSHLAKECPANTYEICKHQDTYFHIWDWTEKTQAGRMGGFQNMESDIKVINRRILLSPDLFKYIWNGFISSAYQISLVGQPLLPVFKDQEISSRLDVISKSLVEKYQRQPIEQFDVVWIYKIHSYLELILIFVSGSFLIFSYKKNKLNVYVRASVQMMLWIYVLNALICGYMTEPMARYSDRILWILPVLAWIQLSSNWPATAAPKRVGSDF